jgi:UDP-N-acetylmuramoyl-L-alanyl-D-glutamate--2,6-diaminopimelate ligase
MGVAAVQGADRVVFTSDNPRSEDPAAILAQTVAPLQTGPNWQLQADRALAIADAVLHAHDRDVVLIAGKGHETSQEVAGSACPSTTGSMPARPWRRAPPRA